MELVLGVFVFFLGASFGSFAGAIAWRVPRQQSILDRSRCDSCRRVLTAKDLVPILSWIFAKGKCKECGASISWKHPLRESVCGAVALFFLFMSPDFFDSPVVSLISIAFLSLSFSLVLSLAEMDFETGMVTDYVAIPALAFAVTGKLLQHGIHFTEGTPWILSLCMNQAIFSAITGGGLIWLLRIISFKKGMGDGDILPMAALSTLSFSGGIAVIDIFLFASFAGVIVMLWRLVKEKKKYSEIRRMPFIPLMLVGWLALQIWVFMGGGIYSERFLPVILKTLGG